MSRSALICSVRLIIAAAGFIAYGGAGLAGTSDTTATVAEISSTSQPYARLEIRYPGVYRVTGRELKEAGVSLDAIQPGALALTCGGAGVPIDVHAGRDDAFGVEDYFDFAGFPPPGKITPLMPENLSNVYILTFSGGDPLHYREAAASPDGGAEIETASFMAREIRERNSIHAWSQLPREETDNFYWLVYMAGLARDQMQRVFLTFPGFDKSAEMPARLSIRVVGNTAVRTLDPQHQFNVHYGDHDLGVLEFDGMAVHDYKTSIPHDKIEERALLSFSTPEDRMSAVDRIFLDFVSVAYPRKLDADNGLFYWFTNELINKDLPSSGVLIENTLPGSRIFAIQDALAYDGGSTSTSVAVAMSDRPTTYVLAAPEARMEVDALSYRNLGNSLLDIDPSLETLVISHGDVRAAADYYTRYRQSRGMKIKNVEAPDIFDALNHGYIEDTALKSYIRYAASKAPGLRYLVLFGDATFDYRQARTFDEEHPPKTLIPIHWVFNPSTTWSAGYMDDNWYGSLAGPYRPDLAVGRIPANNNAEGLAYVKKLIEYEVLQKSQDDQALFISSVENSFQEMVNSVVEDHANKFDSHTILFPETAQADQDVNNLMQEINKGVQFLYYVGHGGAMVWRVGPVDFTKQKDLFTPDNVRELSNAGHYPIVACSSCYTTSFDQQLSLGEVLILEPDKGAIAVFGSPWKATVHEGHRFNTLVMEQYTKPSTERLGDASLHALRTLVPPGTERAAFSSFTLLGDPCLELLK